MFRFSPKPNRANLIEWREWEPEAFQEAQTQDKPVMLFLRGFWCGYSQRMDETSFSDDANIALLNNNFIPVRVEDAQRPDIKLRYMQNGMPTIVFMTPGGDRITTGNYMEPEPFRDVLVRVYEAYAKRAVGRNGETEGEQEFPGDTDSKPTHALGPQIVSEISGMLLGLADTHNGGFGSGLKSPPVEAIEFFLHRYETTGDPLFLSHVIRTLDNMQFSRIYDDVGGGFYRCSFQPDWNSPDRDKLLADQAGLLRNYLHLFLLTGRKRYGTMAERLIEYLNSTLSDPSDAAFYGCEDYVRPGAPGQAAAGVPGEGFSNIDDWVYTDSNALTISAYLDTWWILGRRDCKQRALRALEFLWERCRSPEGRMCHYYDGEPHFSGLLMDQVNMGAALLDAYRATGADLYLERAKELAEVILADYASPDGGFYDIKGERLGALRSRLALMDQNAASAAFLVRLADLTGETGYREDARRALGGFAGDFRRYGTLAAGYGHALARCLSSPLQLTVEGVVGKPQVAALARAALGQLRHPNVVLILTGLTEQEVDPAKPACIYLSDGRERVGPVFDAKEITPELVANFWPS